MTRKKSKGSRGNKRNKGNKGNKGKQATSNGSVPSYWSEKPQVGTPKGGPKIVEDEEPESSVTSHRSFSSLDDLESVGTSQRSSTLSNDSGSDEGIEKKKNDVLEESKRTERSKEQELENEYVEPSALSSLSIPKIQQTKQNATEKEPELSYERSLINNTLVIHPGTNQKCMACDKTVYLVDKLTADNRIYHKACFRCHHCNRTLKLGNFNSFEGVLYCRPHFDQLFKRTGSLHKSFEGIPKVEKNKEKPVESEKATSNKVSSMFAGTRERCVGCNITVYPTERVTVNGTPYHRSCFKCSKGGCTISPSNYMSHAGSLYCKHHHSQLIKEKGNLSQLELDLGSIQVNAQEAPVAE